MKFEMNLSGWVMVLTVLTTFVFLTLKLCGVVAWSWFWTLSPLIFGSGIIGFFIILYIVLSLILAYLESR